MMMIRDPNLLNVRVNQVFQIKCTHKNFKFLVLNSEVEISHQHNIIMFIDNRQFVKVIFIIL